MVDQTEHQARLANQSRTIRLPVHVVDQLAHMRKAEVKLRELLDREPTDEELAHGGTRPAPGAALSQRLARAGLTGNSRGR